ncbi:hypothetical protein B0H11DRAFT_171938 [Mycena galericulata]|nr:hypothetical protein B0H11DRAFT_171938 [Mycena galericulata]
MSIAFDASFCRATGVRNAVWDLLSSPFVFFCGPSTLPGAPRRRPTPTTTVHTAHLHLNLGLHFRLVLPHDRHAPLLLAQFSCCLSSRATAVLPPHSLRFSRRLDVPGTYSRLPSSVYSTCTRPQPLGVYLPTVRCPLARTQRSFLFLPFAAFDFHRFNFPPRSHLTSKHGFNILAFFFLTHPRDTLRGRLSSLLRDSTCVHRQRIDSAPLETLCPGSSLHRPTAVSRHPVTIS